MWFRGPHEHIIASKASALLQLNSELRVFSIVTPRISFIPRGDNRKKHAVHINIPQLPRMQQTGDPHDFLLQLPCKKCVGIRFINKYKEHVVFNVFVLVFMNHGIVLMKSPVKNVNYKEWGTRNISQY